MLLHQWSQISIIAQGVLITLMALSMLSWAIIFTKYYILKRTHQQNIGFIQEFQKITHSKTPEMLTAFQKDAEKYFLAPCQKLFQEGIIEWNRFDFLFLEHPHKTLNTTFMNHTQRALERETMFQVHYYKRWIPWLATIANAAPFIGLFGTVWGIMNAFQKIAESGSADLAQVAPGISEALITTGIGIAVAIPAAMGYNFLSLQLERLETECSLFNYDFLNWVSFLLYIKTTGTSDHEKKIW